MSATILTTTDASFKSDVLESTVPVLVDFWAPWCGPCKAIAPVLEELATDYEGKVQIAKINVDENNQIAAQFGIRSIPTLFVFKGGERVEALVGLQSKEQLAQALDKHI
ncbi:thioredoxin [Psychrobacter sp. HD31]|uniref:thioredoxin n=1 Tax=Psychrobacter sp. HD31 TaxID=3112003 RepID=UPI003DA419DA